MPQLPGALVISLDFELHWGVRDRRAADGPYAANLHGARAAVPAMLRLFAEYDVACTWATVGFLFARSREDLTRWHPRPGVRPQYADARLDPYRQSVGSDEQSDPLHYAPSLVQAILAAPRQELATHTYSHYYCLEPGQDVHTFAADIAAARSAASAYGVALRSIVYPRNQRNPAYDGVLLEAGITAYRGVQRSDLHAPGAAAANTRFRRALRLLDAYAPTGRSYLFDWNDVVQPSGLCDVPASFFFRPCVRRAPGAEYLRQARLRQAVSRAAADGRLVHLWWHPHNFGTLLRENLDSLRRVLDVFVRARDREGMQSLSMAEVAEQALRSEGVASAPPQAAVGGRR